MRSDYGNNEETDERKVHQDILDLAALGGAFGTGEGGAGWNWVADLNRDGKVNILDVSALAGNFGQCGDLA